MERSANIGRFVFLRARGRVTGYCSVFEFRASLRPKMEFFAPSSENSSGEVELLIEPTVYGTIEISLFFQ